MTEMTGKTHPYPVNTHTHTHIRARAREPRPTNQHGKRLIGNMFLALL